MLRIVASDTASSAALALRKGTAQRSLGRRTIQPKSI